MSTPIEQSLRPSIRAFLKRRRETIEAENEAFESMMPGQKRVVIARDVLEQLEAKRLEARQGSFLFSHLWEGKVGKENHTMDLREVFLADVHNDFYDVVPSCTVCGLGALFICAVERADRLPVEKLKDPNRLFMGGGSAAPTVFGYLEQFFEPEQLQLIEIAFEMGSGFMCNSNIVNHAAAQLLNNAAYLNQPLLTDRAINFGTAFCEPFDRMKAIMQNIINNYGTFQP